MISKAPRALIACALSATVAGFFILNQVSPPDGATPAAAAAAISDASANDTQAPGFEADFTDRGAALMMACRDDVLRLCTGAASGRGGVTRCLAERRDDLSDYCRSAMVQRHFNRERNQHAMQD
jgi:hypothetical protein